MLKKFLEEVITIVVGKQAEEIANLLNNKKHINEFIIAKKLGLTINQTRNILYKISDYGLVSFIRKKDKRKGWYTYFWKIEILKSLEFLRNISMKRLDQLDHQIKSRETKRFYICSRCGIEFSEENALSHNFTCSECGDIFAIKDNSNLLKELHKNLNKLKKKIELIDIEIKNEKERLEKIKIKEIKKNKKEVLKKKLEKKSKRKVSKKKKTPKKTKKKIIKKKSKKTSIKKKSSKTKTKKKSFAKSKVSKSKKPVSSKSKVKSKVKK